MPQKEKPLNVKACTSIEGKIRVIRKRIKAIIKMLKNPNVSMLKGNEMIDKTGFKILNPIARRIPPTISVCRPLCKTSPGNITCARYRENA